jgi:trans-2,3-dihydro-3-hydroxyanthranilate isomerase
LATYPFFHIDAFTDTAPGGNACAVVLDADPLDAQTMQAIARDMNLSETAFVVRSEVADFGARYFTPTSEIPMAGHPTIATAWALVEAERVRLGPVGGVVTLELPVGPIRVDVERAPGRPVRMVMTQPRPEFLAELDPARVLPVFGLAAGDVRDDLPVQIVSTGTPQLLVPLRDQGRLRDVAVDGRSFAALIEETEFFSAHLFALAGVTPAGSTFARHFLSPPAVIEDPFTGSATGAMGAYCWRHGLIDTPAFTAEQGHWLGRPGSASVEVVGPRDAIEAVRVGGGAATLVRGELTL